MTKLFAIGGGEIGRPGQPIETAAIDKEIIKQSGKKHPKLLFIPTASKDSAGYISTVQNYFGKKLGCNVDVLLTVNEKPSLRKIREKIITADIIYVGGGNTLYMINKWKSLSIDKLLWEAYQRGTVMSGLSAGAICWFKYGTSDSRMMTNPTFKNYIRVSGLNWFNLTLSPHHIREKKRKLGLIKQIKKYGGVGLALDDYSAIEIIDNTFRIITSKPIAKAHKVYIKNKKVVYEEIKENMFFSIDFLTHGK
jgi:dipeptidase E